MDAAFPPELQRIIDQALVSVDPDDQDFLDALVDAERMGELTREQALTLGSMLGRSRAGDIAVAIMGAG
jgi:hypothetical protein